MLWHLTLAGETAPPRASQLLEIVAESFLSKPFICKPANPEPKHPTTSFIKFLHSGPLFLCSHHPRTKYQTTRDGPCALEPTEIIHTGQSQTCLPCLTYFFPREITMKPLACVLLWPKLPPDTLVLPCAARHGVACPYLLRSVTIKAVFLMICWICHIWK